MLGLQIPVQVWWTWITTALVQMLLAAMVLFSKIRGSNISAFAGINQCTCRCQGWTTFRHFPHWVCASSALVLYFRYIRWSRSAACWNNNNNNNNNNNHNHNHNNQTCRTLQLTTCCHHHQAPSTPEWSRVYNFDCPFENTTHANKHTHTQSTQNDAAFRAPPYLASQIMDELHISTWEDHATCKKVLWAIGGPKYSWVFCWNCFIAFVSYS